MGYVCCRKVNGDFFSICKLNNKGKDLDTYISTFNPDDYYIFKATNKFKEVSTILFFDFKFARYCFFRKEIYDKNWLDLWIDWTTTNLNLVFLHKPFPPFYPQKIKIY